MTSYAELRMHGGSKAESEYRAKSIKESQELHAKRVYPKKIGYISSYTEASLPYRSENCGGKSGFKSKRVII